MSRNSVCFSISNEETVRSIGTDLLPTLKNLESFELAGAVGSVKAASEWKDVEVIQAEYLRALHHLRLNGVLMVQESWKLEQQKLQVRYNAVLKIDYGLHS